ncbi:hypothetical protein DOM22_13300 [Bdellovibrio sp. ZAP7]|uniref:hypothetical protein n=1 Tax=Bdellovibrio sp. ZAP7 TaxID=2231053 RepID=UPI001159D570|nr:hypothetical protein [Bdellovibrio sp. ZAP7]QDK46063.1 hypothetical protein DOM22_13300 [Bdellovibrio sp. ZAP7]
MKLIGAVLGAALLAGCTTKKINYSDVGEYKIVSRGPFIISDSPELWKFLRSRGGERDKKTIQVLISNGEKADHSIQLDKVIATINDERLSLRCRTPESEGTVVLKYRKVIKMSCEMNLSPNEKNKLGLKDTFVSIEVPNDTKNHIVFERLYRIEDFL